MATDVHDRTIDYLRIAVTDRCNFRCTYCMPADGIPLLPHEDILSYEEICRVAEAAASLRIRKIRLTGGEPLVRRDIDQLIEELVAIEGIEDIALTTNGALLAPRAKRLADAGLSRVNVSLDSLDSAVFAEMTRGGRLQDVLDGIDAALMAGLDPVKVNVVVMRGVNDDLAPFVDLTRSLPVHVRFIELMALSDIEQSTFYLSCPELESRLRLLGDLEDVERPRGNGPARYARVRGATGTVGFICPYSEHFCGTCNRLRLTADGKLRLCLFSDDEIDIRTPLRAGATMIELVEQMHHALAVKPQSRPDRAIETGSSCQSGRMMRQIGG